ncbi:MAG: DHH family phosphoesterase [Microbacter sp.]
MLTPIIAETSITEAKKEFEKAHKIVILTHISPDGDALGSALGLYHFFLAMNKKCIVAVPNPFASFFNWLPDIDKVLIGESQKKEIADELSTADLLIMTDFNTLSRIGMLNVLAKEFHGKKILIDHHRNPELDIADIVVSYPTISSTCELVYRLIDGMNWTNEINLSSATAIYMGIMTDTGAFTFNSNTAEIYEIVAELIRKGIDKDEIYNKIFNNYTADRMRLMGYALSNKMIIFEEYRTALISLSKEELKKFNYQEGDTEGFVNLPLSIQNIVFSVLIKENSTNVKLSLRSRGQFAVNQFAAEHFNGGGHLNAAGGESDESFEMTVEKFKQLLPRYKEQLQ